MKLLERWIASGLRKRGYEVRAPVASIASLERSQDDSATEAPWSPAPGSTLGALAGLARRFDVATIIDVGASDGRWSEDALLYFPSAFIFLIEAQGGPHEPGLRKFCERHPNARYLIAAAGHRVGSIHFDTSDPLSGAAAEMPFDQNDAVVPMTTIDAEIERHGLLAPYLLKLDTHGFEREILEGVADGLAQCALLVVEAYNFEIQLGCLRFHQLCEHLEQRGFRCVDIVDVMRRQKDGVLWQCDLVFARADRPEFAANDYA